MCAYIRDVEVHFYQGVELTQLLERTGPSSWARAPIPWAPGDVADLVDALGRALQAEGGEARACGPVRAREGPAESDASCSVCAWSGTTSSDALIPDTSRKGRQWVHVILYESETTSKS